MFLAMLKMVTRDTRENPSKFGVSVFTYYTMRQSTKQILVSAVKITDLPEIGCQSDPSEFYSAVEVINLP